jgi:hypothetical protein
MKRLLLLFLAAIPLFAFQVKFIDNGYDHAGTGWYDEYWEYNGYDCDDGPYWVYYPHGHYCVYYVWWHPWYWDWYWDRCHWHHHWDWDFFACGYYVVWYSDGGWWWRPRYGREVRYKLPYEYSDFRWKARSYGVNLPDKPSREINVPYKENDVRRLMEKKDPELYKRLETEKKNGNLEKIRKDYDVQVKKEIAVKNDEYRKQVKSAPTDRFVPTKDERYDKVDESNGRIQERADDVNNRDNERNIEKSDEKSREPNERYIRKPPSDNDKEDNSRDPQDDNKNKTKKPTTIDKGSANDRDQEKRDNVKNNRSVKTGR